MDEPQQSPPPEQPLSEEELRAAYEEQLRRVRVSDVILQTVVSLLNLGGLRAGLAGPDAGDKDLEQARQAIDGARALLPIVEPELGADAAQLREVLSQLQLAYAREAGSPAPAPAAPEPEAPQGPGPAQSSGRLWVPGQ